MATSRFVDVCDMHDGPAGADISDACAAFEDYLTENGYELAVEVCSYCSAEGGYLGAKDASDLVLNFLGEYPEWDEHQAEIEAHALEIGEVSDIANPDPDEEDFPDEEPDYEPEDEAP